MHRKIGLVPALAGALVLVLAAPAGAGSVYSWVTEDGTYAYTDDAKRIPAKYKKAAKQRLVGKLKNYPQLTRSQVDADDGYAERLGQRLEGLRGQRDVAPHRVGSRQTLGGRNATYLGVRTSSQTALQLPVAPGEGYEPVVVEKVRSKSRGGNSTRTLTVVKQGDRVISVIAPSPPQGDPVQADDSDFY